MVAGVSDILRDKERVQKAIEVIVNDILSWSNGIKIGKIMGKPLTPLLNGDIQGMDRSQR